MTGIIRWKVFFVVGGDELCSTHGGQNRQFIVQHQIALLCVGQPASFRNICQTLLGVEISRFVRQHNLDLMISASLLSFAHQAVNIPHSNASSLCHVDTPKMPHVLSDRLTINHQLSTSEVFVSYLKPVCHLFLSPSCS